MMSAFVRITDSSRTSSDVCFVPTTDSCTATALTFASSCDGHRAATGYDHQLRDVVNLTVDNNGPLAVFAIVLNNRCHLRRFRFSLFDRGRIPAPIWTIVSAGIY